MYFIQAWVKLSSQTDTSIEQAVQANLLTIAHHYKQAGESNQLRCTRTQIMWANMQGFGPLKRSCLKPLWRLSPELNWTMHTSGVEDVLWNKLHIARKCICHLANILLKFVTYKYPIDLFLGLHTWTYTQLPFIAPVSRTKQELSI